MLKKQNLIVWCDVKGHGGEGEKDMLNENVQVPLSVIPARCWRESIRVLFLVSDREDGYPPHTAGMTTGCSLVLLLSSIDTHIVCEITFTVFGLYVP